MKKTFFVQIMPGVCATVTIKAENDMDAFYILKDVEEDIREDYEKGLLNCLMLSVTAECGGCVGEDYLGGSLHTPGDKASIMDTVGQYGMIKNAIAELKKKMGKALCK